MERKRFERPQKGNPHQLPVKQHVWPLRSIARFADGKGDVWLYDKVRNKARRAKPDDNIFCAMRAWDSRAEAGYMKGIEDRFQELASEIIEGTVTTISAEQKETIDAFFALWMMRADYKAADRKPVILQGIIPGESVTKDQEEICEKTPLYFAREDGTMPAHRVYGLQMQVRINAYMRDLSSVQWVVIRTQEGHLVVPDVPAYIIIPLKPTLCLYSGQSGTITKENLGEINRKLRDASHEYFFAQDLAQCP